MLCFVNFWREKEKEIERRREIIRKREKERNKEIERLTEKEETRLCSPYSINVQCIKKYSVRFRKSTMKIITSSLEIYSCHAHTRMYASIQKLPSHADFFM